MPDITTDLLCSGTKASNGVGNNQVDLAGALTLGQRILMLAIEKSRRTRSEWTRPAQC